MSLYLVAITHHTATSQELESVYLDQSEREELGARLLLMGIGSVFIATCNRFELVAEGSDASLIHRVVMDYMATRRSVTPLFWRRHAVIAHDREAMLHLFKVASGMDSMIIGEDEILSQVKNAYALYLERGYTTPVLNKVFQLAISVGKRARHETSISKGSYSVSSLAIDYFRKLDLEWFNRSVLIVGAGMMGIRTLKKLHALGHQRLTLVNRTDIKLRPFLESFKVNTFPFEALSTRINDYDVVVMAVAVPRPIVTASWNVAQVQLMLDLGMPRNIEVGIGQHVITVETLKSLTDANVAKRRDEMEKVSEIIEAELDRFAEWVGYRETVVV